MEHLVRDHDTKMYYTSTQSIGVIRETCPDCGNWDTIVMSYEEGKKDIALEEYFSRIQNSDMYITKCTDAGLTKKNIIAESVMHYKSNEKMILDLYKSRIITKEEVKKYIKIAKEAEKKDLKKVKKSLRFHLSRDEKRNR